MQNRCAPSIGLFSKLQQVSFLSSMLTFVQ
jgi:hypothetical protein